MSRGTALDGSVVWITGASSGIGEALVRKVEAKGARVVLSARRGEVLETVRQSLSHPDRHLVVPLDLAQHDTFPAAVERVLDFAAAAGGGGIDVLVHNAGISQRSLAKETELAVDRRLLEVNTLGPIALTKAALPSMLERGEGRLVVVSSLVGKIGTPLRSTYSASKHALHGFFESLRAETFDAGLRVTMVCPGFIKTEITYHALTGDGSPQGSLDRAQAEGMAPEDCAARIVRAIESGEDEILVGGREVWAVRLARFFPGLFRRLIRRARVT